MVRVDGIEPTTSAWKADVLPLNYTRKARMRVRCRTRDRWVKLEFKESRQKTLK